MFKKDMNRRFKYFFIIFISVCFCTDTDGDGDSDKLELEIGTDPNNKEDRYYYGSWPYNPDKDRIEGDNFPIICPSSISCDCESNEDCVNNNCQRSARGDWHCTPKPGDLFPHFIAVDQYGEFVDIYDFSMQGKIIAIEFGAAWCSPCRELSSWLSSGDNAVTNNRWWKDEYAIIKQKIDRGEIYFITILFQDHLRDVAGYETVEDWHRQYPNNMVPVLADEYADIHQWIKPTGYPCVNLLDENMRLVNFTGRGIGEAFDILSGIKPIPKANNSPNNKLK